MSDKLFKAIKKFSCAILLYLTISSHSINPLYPFKSKIIVLSGYFSTKSIIVFRSLYKTFISLDLLKYSGVYLLFKQNFI